MPLFSRLSRPDQAPVIQLPVSVIAPNPNQPRRTFSRSSLQEMALSIRELGILQPLTVRQGEHGWELVAGERRLRAAVLAGLERVPCIAVEADDSRSTLMALVENIQRQDLDFWEEAREAIEPLKDGLMMLNEGHKKEALDKAFELNYGYNLRNGILAAAKLDNSSVLRYVKAVCIS